MRPGRILAILALGGAIVFAFRGGEYSTMDLRQLRREEAEERRQVAALERMVDSLERAAVALERDPKVQERVARESFGMIRRGEFLYRFIPGEPGDAGERGGDPDSR